MLPDETVFTTVEAHLWTWELSFDGACRTEWSNEGPTIRAGAGIVFVRLDGYVLHYSYALLEEKTNNQAEYEALIVGLEMALEMDIYHLRAYGDSQLAIRQINGIYTIRKEELLSYHERVMLLMNSFHDIQVDHVPRGKNSRVDALTKLAMNLALPPEGEMEVLIKDHRLLTKITKKEAYLADQSTTQPLSKDDWRKMFVDFFEKEALRETREKRIELKRQAPSFTFKDGVLY